MELTIKYMPTNEIKPYENNPRKNDEAVRYVAESIKQFGFKNPVILDKNNVIVAGHTRLKAAEELGIEEVPCIYADDLTEEQAKAFRLADNKVAEIASWDFGKLEEELADIDIDMSEFGFDVKMQDDQTEIIEDDAPEQAEPRCKLGDLWQLGNHRLICGDSTNVAVIDRLMDGAKAELLLTDPPYGINVVRGGTSEQATGRVGGWPAPLQEQSEEPHRSTSGKVGGGSMKTPKNKRISPDAVVPAKTYSAIIGDETTKTAKKSYEVGKAVSDNQIIFGGNYFTDFLPVSRCWIVWDKDNTGNFADAELAWTSFDKGVRLYKWTWNGLVRQGDRKTEGITRLHPTQKPVGMLAEIIKDFSKEGSIILDLFGGSGSTLIACEQLNRKCYMCELDPTYCDVIIKRYEDFTGKTAELIERN